MHWLIFAILSAISFGLYDFFIKLSSEKSSPTIALMIISGITFLITLIATIFLKTSGHKLIISKEGIWWLVTAGVLVTIGDILYIIMFSKNVPLNLGNPFVVGGTIITAIIFSIIFLKEPLELTRIFGIIFTLFGLILLTKS